VKKDKELNFPSTGHQEGNQENRRIPGQNFDARAD
jgi:hypothetical protein